MVCCTNSYLLGSCCKKGCHVKDNNYNTIIFVGEEHQQM